MNKNATTWQIDFFLDSQGEPSYSPSQKKELLIIGDLARVDPDDCLRIVGCENDMIISGGFNIYASEVEAVRRRFGGVADFAVIGVPHPDFGEAVVAVIVPDAGTDLDKAAIRCFAQKHLTSYKTPKAIIMMEKVIESDLRSMHRELFTVSVPPCSS
jgi:malonyl-CoA/methylmalonyl-CoA synthetase